MRTIESGYKATTRRGGEGGGGQRKERGRGARNRAAAISESLVGLQVAGSRAAP